MDGAAASQLESAASPRVGALSEASAVAAVNDLRFVESPVDVPARLLEAVAPQRTVGRGFGRSIDRVVMSAQRVAEFRMNSVSPAS